MDDKYKREDVDRFMFVIRYYYLICDAAHNKNNTVNVNINANGVTESSMTKNHEDEEFIETVVSNILFAEEHVLGCPRCSHQS